MTGVASRFATASSDVLQIAEVIASGGVPEASMLDHLTNDQLNLEYGQIDPSNAAAGYGHSLLREAVVSRNLAAARVLIAAGADAFFNDNEMAFLGVQMVTQHGQRVWWPDYSEGTAFVKLWLKSGGDPNASNAFYGRRGNLLVAADPSNLEGILTLLEAGTDPWHSAPVVLGGVPRASKFPSFFAGIATLTPQALELNFRIAQADLYRPGHEEQSKAVIDSFDMGIKNILEGSSGPTYLRRTWQLQMALNTILPALDVPPTEGMRDILSVTVPDEYKGFWLAPDAIRSPNDGSHVLRNDNQWGSKHWDG